MPKAVHITSVHAVDDNRIRYKQCRSLAAHGYEVVLVGANGESSEGDDGVSVQVLKKPASRLKRFLFTGWAVTRRALSERADIYHFHDPELMPFAQLLRLRGKRVVFDMHENFPKAILDKHWIPALLRRPVSWVARLLERVLLFRIPVVFAEASYRDDYEFVRRFAVVQNFPDISALQSISAPKNGVFSLGYMGGVSEVRGAGVMLHAYRKLTEAGHNVELHCVGPGTLPIDDPARMPEGVKMYGFLPAAEGFAVMARCHVGLAVLMPIPNYVRSYPTKMFEYMALGLPIIVSDFPLYRAALGDSDCGFLVDPERPEQVVEALEQLLADPDAAAAMGQRGKAHVMREYAWANEMEHLLRLYEA